MNLDPEDPLAVAVTEAIRTGDLEGLGRLLATHPGLATARLGDDRSGGGSHDETPLHWAASSDDVEVSRAFWGACHGGQRACAEYLLERGADPNWVPPWEPLTPLDTAARSGADALVRWLRDQGARPPAELSGDQGLA